METKIKHFFATIYDFLSSSWSYIVMLCTLILTNDTTVLISFLFSMLLLDYVTGIIATYVESDGKYKVYLIESKKLRESGVKIIGYMLLMICGWFITRFIYTDSIALFGIIRSFNVLQIVLIMSIGIEFFSNIENLKRSGFDILGRIKSNTSKVWELIKSVRGQQ